MPVPSPFHERTAALCTSYQWKEWAGYYAVRSYDTSHDREYFALREAAGLLDVTPLFKYDLRGPDAAALLARMTVRDLTRLPVGRVAYCCWCDDDGKVVDDGTVTRLEADHYRLTAADPTFHWLESLAHGFDVRIEDTSARLAALALQGPTSRHILRQASDAPVERLGFFRAAPARIDGTAVWVTRTGYTGDLGYEIWMDATAALPVWDALTAAGRTWGLEPVGLDALDVARIEAGFVLQGVDYFSAHRTVVEARKSSPYEIGMGWMVQLDRAPFVGRAALAAARRRRPAWSLVGLEASWEEIEALYERHGLPPTLPARASREGVPVYAGDRQVGQATSHTWSPILKKSVALASVRTEVAKPGSSLEIEHTVEYRRERVSATVVRTPFFDPERKRRP